MLDDAPLTAIPDLPCRRGPRPRTLRPNPHTQLDQQAADTSLRGRVADMLFSLEGVREEPSAISVPGARAAVLDSAVARGPAEAFMVRREFAHLHPSPDGSLHAMLPLDWVEATVAAGWTEPHPVVAMGLAPTTAVLIYAPRDEHELDVVQRLLAAAHDHARGCDDRSQRDAGPVGNKGGP